MYAFAKTIQKAHRTRRYTIREIETGWEVVDLGPREFTGA